MTMSNNPGSRETAAGLAVMLLAVSAGLGSGDLAVLLGLVGVLVGANLLAIGVKIGEEPAISRAVLAGVHVVTAFLHRNLAVAGVILASSAVTAVAGTEAGPVLCFTMLVVLLIAMCQINFHVLGE